jgi:hypothetical protein
MKLGGANEKEPQQEEITMTRHYLAGVAAIALALGMTAAGAQNVDQRRNTDEGKPADQVERNQQTSDQSQKMPSQQRRDQGGAQNQQGTQAPQQNPPNTTGQNATDRQQGGQQPEQRQNQQQQGAQQQNAPVTSGQSQQGAREPQQGQGQQQGAQTPQTGRSQPGAQGPRQGGEKQQGAENEQPDRSGRIALDEREQMRISDIIRQQRIQPVTNINFSLNVGSTVPSSVRLARISGELADIFPHYRNFSFFVAKQELVIVDSQSYGIVGFVPISGGATVGVAPPREETGAVSTAAPTAAPPAPAKKKAVHTEKKRVTVTEEKPRVIERETIERETIRRSPAHTETEATVGASRRDIEVLDEPPPRDRRIGPPVRERYEHDEGPPFPFSLFFGGPY